LNEAQAVALPGAHAPLPSHAAESLCNPALQ
jgi:hypothetical protein